MGSFAVHRMTQLEQQVDRLTRELAQARAEVASLTTYRDGLDKNVTELEAQNERLRAALRDLFLLACVSQDILPDTP
jgi:phage shock protein A